MPAYSFGIFLSITRCSALRTDGSTYGLPLSSRYAPTETDTFFGSVSLLKASTRPRIASGGPIGTFAQVALPAAAIARAAKPPPSR